MKDLWQIFQDYNNTYFIVYAIILLLIISADILKHIFWKWRHIINATSLLLIIFIILFHPQRLCACWRGHFIGLVHEWIIKILLGYQIAITLLNALIPVKIPIIKDKNNTNQSHQSDSEQSGDLSKD